MKKTIIIGSDHAGYNLKEKVKNLLKEEGFIIKDVGTHSDESTDYAEYAHELGEEISNGDFDKGILICGSANGVSMAANKHTNVRAAIAWNEEIAQLARKHNNANVLSLPARYLTDDEAEAVVKAFLVTEFEGGRHERRVNKINI